MSTPEPTNTDKYIETVERYHRERTEIGPDPELIDIHTRDGWSYRFRRLREDEPFQFVRKRRNDTAISDDAVVPLSICRWFEATGGVELVDAVRAEQSTA